MDDREKEIMEMCNKYGVKCEIKFGHVFIDTGCERFFFEVFDEGAYVRLFHMNRFSKNGSTTFHEQFRARLSLEKVIIYITEHTASKYKGKWVNYKVRVPGKKGSKKPAPKYIQRQMKNERRNTKRKKHMNEKLCYKN